MFLRTVSLGTGLGYNDLSCVVRETFEDGRGVKLVVQGFDKDECESGCSSGPAVMNGCK